MNNMEKLEELEKGIQDLAYVVQKMNQTIKWYEDYSKVIYANKPNLDEYACEYADKQKELRNQ